jgi:polysaccharide export outer membrane protein
MRLVRLLVVALLTAAQAGCAGLPAPEIAAPVEPAPPPDLDTLMYARGAGLIPPPQPAVLPLPAVLPEPPPLLPVPAALLPPPPAGGDEPYRLDTGDRLRVVVYGQDGLSNTYIVDASGKITIPLIGAVSARWCTTGQLARAIAARLRNGYVREPHVAIEVETYRPFFILGEVLAPGQYPYVPNMTVETAVAIAGGFTPRAYRYDFEVSRSSMGVTSRQKVPLIAPLLPGDTVTVSERWF